MMSIITGYKNPFLPKKEAEKRRRKITSKMQKAGLKGYKYGLIPNLTGKLFAVTIEEK